MTMTFRAWSALGVLALLGACSTVEGSGGRRAAGGMSVTRFHLGGEIARGTIAVEPRFETQAAGGVYQPAFAASVANELRTLGFTPAPAGSTSEFVATVDVATGTAVALAARAPGSPVAAGEQVDPATVGTQLAVQLKRRSDGSIVWQGRARMPAKANAVASAANVQTLARALFRDFPGESGRTITAR